MGKSVVFSLEAPLCNEWMDLDTTVMVPNARKCDDFGPNVARDHNPNYTGEKTALSWLRSLEECQRELMRGSKGRIYGDIRTDPDFGVDCGHVGDRDFGVDCGSCGDEQFLAPCLDELAEMHSEEASQVDPDADDCVTVLEGRVDCMSHRLGKIAVVAKTCLDVLMRIEELDRDVMRMAVMFAGYSEGE